MAEKKCFGTLPSGEDVYQIVLSGSGITVSVLTYGATIRQILVKDGQYNGKSAQDDEKAAPDNGEKTGEKREPVDVVLGYDSLEAYRKEAWYLGATIGRVANRISGASFDLNGEHYPLAANEGGLNSHGGMEGFDKKNWEIVKLSEDAAGGEDFVTLRYISPDMEEGFPGTLTAEVTFSVSGEKLEIRYKAETDRDTIVNLTNHSYFNLAGQGAAPVTGHLMKLRAGAITEIDEKIVPTGRILPVKGTPFDFREAKKIGADIDAENAQIRFAGGYDHNFVLDPAEDGLFAEVWSPESGICMKAYTSEPGVQLYTPDDLQEMQGKEGRKYGIRPAFCLETQHYADAVHQPSFPSIVLKAGGTFSSRTAFQFCFCRDPF